MKKLVLALGCIVLGLSGETAWAEDAAALQVSARHAYAYATSPVQKNGAVFVELHNDGETPVKITAAQADVAARVELHTHIMNGDVMMMRQVESYDIPAGQTVILKPMSHHIMLMGLKAPLVAGESFPMTISDEHGAQARFDVEVKNPGDVAGEHTH